MKLFKSLFLYWATSYVIVKIQWICNWRVHFKVNSIFRLFIIYRINLSLIWMRFSSSLVFIEVLFYCISSNTLRIFNAYLFILIIFVLIIFLGDILRFCTNWFIINIILFSSPRISIWNIIVQIIWRCNFISHLSIICDWSISVSDCIWHYCCSWWKLILILKFLWLSCIITIRLKQKTISFLWLAIIIISFNLCLILELWLNTLCLKYITDLILLHRQELLFIF